MAGQRTQCGWFELVNQTKELVSKDSSSDFIHLIGTLTVHSLAQMIDHTLLKTDATEPQIDKLCEEARVHGFKSVCVRLPWVARAVKNLEGSEVIVACVVGFHEGTYSEESKTREAQSAVEAGAMELDMVINHEWLRQKQYPEVYEDVEAVRMSAPHPTILKVILETSVLTDHDIIAGCKIAEYAGADFVKTSTGFNGPGATIPNVRLMRRLVGDKMKVKASGGIKNFVDTFDMIRAGAHRLGASSSVKIIQQAKQVLPE